MSQMQIAQKDFIQPHAFDASLFGGLAIEHGITSGMAMGHEGSILQSAQRVPIQTRDAEYGIFTGIDAATNGAVPATRRDKPQLIAGSARIGSFKTTFGLYSITHSLEHLATIGMRHTAQELFPIRVAGNPFIDDGGLAPSGLSSGNTINLSDPATKMQFEMFTGLIRDMAPDIYAGDGATVNPWKKRVYGLSGLVNTGYKDFSTPALTPMEAADSWLDDWAAAGDINSTTALAQAFFAKLTDLYVTVKDHAAVTGLDNGQRAARWEMAMSPRLFRQAIYLWPVLYAKARGDASLVTLNVDVGTIKREIDAMKQGKYLILDGDIVPVRTDRYLPETENAGIYTSDVYIVPVQVLGGANPFKAFYFNFDAPGAAGDAAVRALMGDTNTYQTLDQGRFLMIKNPMTNGARDFILLTWVMLALQTPQIAARLQNVQYSATTQLAPIDPTDPNYRGGGELSRTTATPANPT